MLCEMHTCAEIPDVTRTTRQAIRTKIASYGGYIFVTPEYNHSTSGVLKNAIDYLYGEWNNKAAAFVSYGPLGGARAIEHLRAICSELQIAHVRQQLSFSVFTDFENFATFALGPQHDAAATTLLTSSNPALQPGRPSSADRAALTARCTRGTGPSPRSSGAGFAPPRSDPRHSPPGIHAQSYCWNTCAVM